MKILPVLLAALAATPAVAALRTSQAANLEARRFMNERLGRVADLRAVEVATDAPYYLYNEANGNGFVMLSKSDRLRPVLAYSDTHNLSLDDENLPDGLRGWLHWVEEATATLEDCPEAALTAAQLAADVSPVSPLLGNIQWNQDSPWNNLCPTLDSGDHAAVGCVATAMAQTVYYHRYPEHGTGSRSYTEYETNRKHEVNFEEQTYDYSLMFDRYNKNSATQAQCNEVAKLSYHMGVSVDMSYGEESGSYTYWVADALVNYFGYDPLAQVCCRESYTYDEWQELLLNELYNQRPIVFGGQSTEGGHCFVVDGVNSSKLYHVNWGWGGYYDGYYDIALLNPEGVGIGATESESGFSWMQHAIVQLGAKDQLTGKLQYISPLACTSLSKPTGNIAFGNNISINIGSLTNYSREKQTGKVGYVWVQDGQRMATSLCSKTVTVNGSSIWAVPSASLSGSVPMPSTLADGDYEVYAFFQPSSGVFADSIAILHFRSTEAGFLHCKVQGRVASFIKDAYGDTLRNKLVPSDWSYETQEYETGFTQTIRCTLTNNSGSGFCGQYYLKLTSPSKASEDVPSKKLLTLEAGESKELSFEYTFPTAGTWTSELYVNRQNVDDTKLRIYNTKQTFTVVPGRELTLLAEPILLQEYYDKNGQGQFGLYVKNTGADYHGPLQILFLSTKTATKPTLTLESEVEIAANATDTLVVTGTLTGVKQMTKYYITGRYYRGGDYEKFVLTDGVTNFTQIPIYKEGQHADAIEQIVTDGETHTLRSSLFLPKDIYLMDGKKVLIRE